MKNARVIIKKDYFERKKNFFTGSFNLFHLFGTLFAVIKVVRPEKFRFRGKSGIPGEGWLQDDLLLECVRYLTIEGLQANFRVWRCLTIENACEKIKFCGRPSGLQQ